VREGSPLWDQRGEGGVQKLRFAPLLRRWGLIGFSAFQIRLPLLYKLFVCIIFHRFTESRQFFWWVGRVGFKSPDLNIRHGLKLLPPFFVDHHLPKPTGLRIEEELVRVNRADLTENKSPILAL